MKNLLDVLNSMQISDYSTSCGECEYVLVDDTEENRQILLNAGLSEKEIDKYADNGTIDISLIAWEKTDANYWNKEIGFFCGQNAGIWK